MSTCNNLLKLGKSSIKTVRTIVKYYPSKKTDLKYYCLICGKIENFIFIALIAKKDLNHTIYDDIMLQLWFFLARFVMDENDQEFS
jgi:hypothetical protein